jgi:hypothetical protein
MQAPEVAVALRPGAAREQIRVVRRQADAAEAIGLGPLDRRIGRVLGGGLLGIAIGRELQNVDRAQVGSRGRAAPARRSHREAVDDLAQPGPEGGAGVRGAHSRAGDEERPRRADAEPRVQLVQRSGGRRRRRRPPRVEEAGDALVEVGAILDDQAAGDRGPGRGAGRRRAVDADGEGGRAGDRDAAECAGDDARLPGAARGAAGRAREEDAGEDQRLCRATGTRPGGGTGGSVRDWGPGHGALLWRGLYPGDAAAVERGIRP